MLPFSVLARPSKKRKKPSLSGGFSVHHRECLQPLLRSARFFSEQDHLGGRTDEDLLSADLADKKGAAGEDLAL